MKINEWVDLILGQDIPLPDKCGVLVEYSDGTEFYWEYPIDIVAAHTDEKGNEIGRTWPNPGWHREDGGIPYPKRLFITPI